jgi:hypothetical protein
MSEIPDRLLAHWQTAPDTMRNVQFDFDPVVFPAMIPSSNHVFSMGGISKVFKLLPFMDESIRMDSYEGFTYAMIDKCNVSIPPHIQNAMFLFNNICNVPNLAGYVLPTAEVDIQKDTAKSHTIVGLTTTVERVLGPTSNQRYPDFVSTERLVRDRMLSTSQTRKTKVPPLRMRLAFTGATFKVRGVDHRANFCVLLVTPVSNFAMWECLHEVVLKKPKTMNFKKQYEEWLDLNYFAQAVMRYEMSENLLLSEKTFGVPEMYHLDHDGCLGAMTILNPFTIPFKIVNRILSEYPHATDIEIMGVPRMAFSEGEPQTEAWARLVHHYANSGARSR